ncbi:MAG: hypothetical protein RR198_01370 [Oscillospiraceae bacterium]
MKQRRVFFASFLITFFLMLCAFGILYLSMDVIPKESAKDKAGIAINQPGIDDSKTILLCVGEEDCLFFFLIKLNALQNKISIMGISPSFPMTKSSHTLAYSMEKAGIMQCVYDLKNEFELSIDYYLHCNFETIATILEDFSDFGVGELGENLPEGVKKLLIKGAEKLDINSLANIAKSTGEFLDNQVGLGFLNESAYILMKYNLAKLPLSASEQIQKNYSKINTSLNVISLEKLETIVNFLIKSEPKYLRDIITREETDALKKVGKLFKE